jgi:hypothetical protein
MNRAVLKEAYRFGGTIYAKEELWAELTSVFLAVERGIPMIRIVTPLMWLRGSKPSKTTSTRYSERRMTPR